MEDSLYLSKLYIKSPVTQIFAYYHQFSTFFCKRNKILSVWLKESHVIKKKTCFGNFSSDCCLVVLEEWGGGGGILLFFFSRACIATKHLLSCKRWEGKEHLNYLSDTSTVSHTVLDTLRLQGSFYQIRMACNFARILRRWLVPLLLHYNTFLGFKDLKMVKISHVDFSSCKPKLKSKT